MNFVVGPAIACNRIYLMKAHFLLMESDSSQHSRMGSFFIAGLIFFVLSIVGAVADAPQISLPSFVVEGSGTLTNAGRLLAGPANSNMVFSVQSSDPASLAVPATVTLTSGQTNVAFDLAVGDNSITDGDRLVTITASNPAFTNAVAMVKVLDDDPDHIVFGAVSPIVETNSGQGLMIKAVRADGSLQTNFSRGLTIVAQGLEGVLPVTPTNVMLYQGQAYASFQVPVLGHAVQLRVLEYPGQSDPYTVVPPVFYSINQTASDVAWHEASHTLLASVPATGGVYSNCLVAIDPATGVVTNTYPVGMDPKKIEMSPNGNYLYISLGDATKLQRFDMNTRTAGTPFQLATNVTPFRFAYDFCVPPGLSDAVVVAARDQDNLGNTSIAGIYRYSSGVPSQLAGLSASGGWLVESLNAGRDVVVSPSTVRGDALSGNVLATAASFAGSLATFRGGQIFDYQGGYYDTNTLALLGTYPNVLDQIYYTSLPEVNPEMRRVFYLAGYFNFGSSIYKLKVYDRDLQQQLFQLTVPGSPGSPTRFLRCGTNALVYANGSQIWFIRPEAVQPPVPAADLALSVSGLPPTAVIGTGYTFTLSLSNAGPGTASIVRVTNALPNNTVVTGTSPSSGSVALDSSAFTWTIASLPAGSNATLQVTLNFTTGGWQTNITWALGFESDPIATNNILRIPMYVQLPTNTFGAFPVNYSSEDMFFDPARNRLVLSVGTNQPAGQTNGLAIFNPDNGLIESFTPLAKKPGKLARTDDGQYAYVSLPLDGLVRRLNLTSLSANLEFALGGEYIYGVWYPYYASDLAAVPGAPQSLVVWRVRQSGPMAGEYGEGIALFQNGVVAANVTSSGGSWTVEFDTNSGTLYGYASGQLARCSLDSNGVSFVEQYPTLYNAGSDIKFGGGQFFTSAGRVVRTQPFSVPWLFSGADSATLVIPDPKTGRVFYLVQANGWQINAYDVAAHRLLGAIPLANVAGTPSSLIRWGTSGLAFRTSANQLYIIRSPLVQTNAAADLALTLVAPTRPVAIGSNVVFTLTVSNQGPAQATAIWLTNTFSAPVNLISWTSSSGTVGTNGGQIIWNLSNLNVGAQATLSYTLNSYQTGLVTVTAAAVSQSSDPFPGNNTAQQAFIVGAPIPINAAAILQLPANDIAWSPSLGKLLVTSSTNTVNWGGALLTVDPYSYAVQFQVTLGSDAGRLVTSRDDAALHVGVDFGVVSLSLPSLSPSNSFLINPADPRGYAYALKSQPGSNQVVVVGSRSRNDNSTWVSAYNNGTPLTNSDSFFSTGLTLEFADDPATLYVKDFSGNGFRTYALNPPGLTLQSSDAGVLPTQTAMDLLWKAGKMFTSIGKVINPTNRTVISTISGIPSGARVQYDTDSDRVFYLSPNGNQAVLQAFDGPTLLPIGNQTIQGISGSLNDFVHFGADGFAAVTTAGQVAIFHSSLVATNPPADLSITLSSSAPPYLAGSNITSIILITNAGPNPALDVAWNNALPSGTVIIGATTSAGILVTNLNAVSGTIPVLTNGAIATVNVTYSFPNPGIVTNMVSVNSSSKDPAYSNNVAAAFIWVQPVAGPAPMTLLNLPVKDLERDPVRPLFYVSFGANAGVFANTVAPVDPINGIIGPAAPVGSDPGRLAASADGQFLYVALDGQGIVQKLSLPGLVPVGSLAVPLSQVVSRMLVCPTNSDMVALRRTPGGQTSLFVSGVKLPNELASQDLFAFSPASGQLYGCDGFHSNVKLYRLNTAANGLSLLEGQAGKQSSSADLKGSGNLLFFDRGMVLNADAQRVLAIMPVPVNSIVEPDTGSGRVFYLTPVGSSWTLRAFDITQGIEVGNLPLSGLLSAPRKLVRWGADGLALFTTNSQVVILRGQLVPTNPPVDVVLSQKTTAVIGSTNSTLSLSLQLTNFGPVTASGVIVTQAFSLNVTNVVLTPSMGSAGFTNNLVTWQVGSLVTNISASLSTSLRATQTGSLTVASSAYHNLNDSFWGNNVSFNVVNITNSTTSNNVIQLRLACRELIYDSLRNLIYASTPASNRLAGNLIAAIDPATGELRAALPAGSEPDQLALSDDNQFLYAGLDGAVGAKRFNLQSNLADLSFQFGTNDIYFAQDLEVQPNHPDTVTVSLGSYNLTSGFPSDVWLYDHGIARTNKGGPARGLTFAGDGAALFGYVAPGSGNAIVRMWPVSNGFLTDFQSAYSSLPGNLKSANGRLYAASGQVADPYAPALLGTFSGGAGPQAIDAVGGRAYVLAQKGSAWEIRAFNMGTFAAIGTNTVPGVLGTPSSLIRCGADRLAFCTTSNQLFILHSSLVVTNPIATANIAVKQQAVQDFSGPVETIRFTMSVTNSGPGTASNLLLAISPPPQAASVSVQLQNGTSTNIGTRYLCSLGSLSAGQSFWVILNAGITNTATFTNFASLTSVSPDPDLSDNTSTAIMNGVFFARRDSLQSFAIASTALAYDPVRQRLFAVLAPQGATNLLAWFDPQTGAMAGSMPLDFSANIALVTDDGQYLYLSSTSTNRVERLALSSLSLDLIYNTLATGAIRAAAIIPGQPHALALTYWNGGNGVTAMFDDGVSRSNQIAKNFVLITVSDDSSALFGYENGSTGGNSPDVFRMVIATDGLQSLDNGPSDTPWGANVQMRHSRGLLFFANGNVLDPSTWTEQTNFTLPYWGTGFDLIPCAGEMAFLSGDPVGASQSHMGIYSISNRQLLAQFNLTGLSSSLANLVWCGADRLAFRSATQLYLVRSSVVPSGDISVKGMFTTNQIMVGSTVNLQVVISNAGPSAVSGVWITNLLPVGLTLVSATLTNGTITTNLQTVVGALDNLATNGIATLTMALSANPAAIGWLTNAVDVGAAGIGDAITANNHATQSLLVMPVIITGVTISFDPQQGTNALQFTVQGNPGTTYSLDASIDLIHWTSALTFICQQNSQVVQTAFDWASSNKFYRLRALAN